MKEVPKDHRKQENKQHLLGWILFFLCALFFIASSLKNGDLLTFIGSVLFLISCIFFIVPLVRRMKISENETNESSNKAN
jgi:predicted membrane channel-forming protein YqfA (hemolysin III family)